MNTRHEFIRKIATYLFAIFYFFVVAGFAQAQSNIPTQAQLDALKALGNKMPTATQGKELVVIGEKRHKKAKILEAEATRFSEEMLDKCESGSPCSITAGDVERGVEVHKKARDLVIGHIDEVEVWGRRYDRISCVRQSQALRGYTLRMSAAWMKNAKGLSLVTRDDRWAAAVFLSGTSGELGLGPYPFEGPGALTGYKLVGLGNVCFGANEFDVNKHPQNK